MLEFLGSWAEKVASMEFGYNNSHHQSLEMSPYEALHRKKCQSPIYWHKAGKRKFLGLEKVDKVS